MLILAGVAKQEPGWITNLTPTGLGMAACNGNRLVQVTAWVPETDEYFVCSFSTAKAFTIESCEPISAQASMTIRGKVRLNDGI